MKAQIAFALGREDIGPPLRAWLAEHLAQD